MIAHANRFSYSEAYALADARRAGMSEDVRTRVSDGFQFPLERVKVFSEFDRKPAASAQHLGSKVNP